MELKPYQQQVLDDLDAFLTLTDKMGGQYAAAFNRFWLEKVGPYNPLENKGMAPYKDNVPGVPNVCMKVPTAGGKTFVACNALKTIYDHYHFNTAKAVVWLVPGITILDQTLKNLNNPAHPYRSRIDLHFNGRVQVFEKDALLNPRGFTPAGVQEHLSIFVLSFDSFRSRSKDNRKMYQENGMLLGHKVAAEAVLEGTDETALINVIRSLNPVVIVDESHNAESELSVEMLRNLRPSFILDLTATPRNNSNIISYVDALQLKKENMVKLPVIVYNHKSKEGVIESAINLRHKLEKDAKAEQKSGGAFIRPIVLFQAQPRTGEEQTTFEKIKAALIQIGIPPEEIKIKTADINELKNENLLGKDSKVRYIITVNALKEGWDCSFAYILASLADKSSAVDVEQIVGRILRQPYARQHQNPMLNMSFVLTASSRFLETLGTIVKGLNKAGFSPKDYTVAHNEWLELEQIPAPQTPEGKQLLLHQLQQGQVEQPSSNLPVEEGETEEIRIEMVKAAVAGAVQSPITDEVHTEADESLKWIQQQAMQQNEQLQKQIDQINQTGEQPLPTEIAEKVTTYKIKPVFAAAAQHLVIPQFIIREENMFSQTAEGGDEMLLAKENLLDEFRLTKEDTKLDFESIKAEMFKIELEETAKGETDIRFSEVQKKFQPVLLEYFSGEINDRAKSQFHGVLFKLIGNMPPIADAEIKKYLKKILEGLEPAELKDIAANPYFFTPKIKEKIWQLADKAAERQFNDWLDTDKIQMAEKFRLKGQLIHKSLAAPITKSLYEREEAMNKFEEDVAVKMASLENVLFWHKNPVSRGFCINGFLNHYPDFIVVTKAGKVILVETKGDHLDGSDSQAKIRLGRKWAEKAGNQYRYYMVFESRQVPEAVTVDELIDKLGKL